MLLQYPIIAYFNINEYVVTVEINESSFISSTDSICQCHQAKIIEIQFKETKKYITYIWPYNIYVDMIISSITNDNPLQFSFDKNLTNLSNNRFNTKYECSENISSEINLKNGKPHGTCKLWYKNGQLKCEIQYRNSKLHGTFNIFL